MSARGRSRKSNNEKKSSKYCRTIKYTVLVVAKESESTQIKIDFVFMKTFP